MPMSGLVLAKKIRDMHALAADSCDPEYSMVMLEAAAEIERLKAEIKGLQVALDALKQAQVGWKNISEYLGREPPRV